MADQPNPTIASESSESLDPANPIDAKLLQQKAAFYARADHKEIEQRIQREQSFGQSDQNDAEIARMKAAYEAGKGQESAVATEGAPVDFNQARSEFGRILGLPVGSHEFDGATAEFASWYDDHASDPGFDDMVRKAEKMFGTEEVLRVAHQLAKAHARKKR